MNLYILIIAIEIRNSGPKTRTGMRRRMAGARVARHHPGRSLRRRRGARDDGVETARNGRPASRRPFARAKSPKPSGQNQVAKARSPTPAAVATERPRGGYDDTTGGGRDGGGGRGARAAFRPSGGGGLPARDAAGAAAAGAVSGIVRRGYPPPDLRDPGFGRGRIVPAARIHDSRLPPAPGRGRRAGGRLQLLRAGLPAGRRRARRVLSGWHRVDRAHRHAGGRRRGAGPRPGGSRPVRPDRSGGPARRYGG